MIVLRTFRASISLAILLQTAVKLHKKFLGESWNLRQQEWQPKSSSNSEIKKIYLDIFSINWNNQKKSFKKILVVRSIHIYLQIYKITDFLVNFIETHELQRFLILDTLSWWVVNSEKTWSKQFSSLLLFLASPPSSDIFIKPPKLMAYAFQVKWRGCLKQGEREEPILFLMGFEFFEVSQKNYPSTLLKLYVWAYNYIYYEDI